MKIEKVHIKNIKGIKDLELSFKKNNKILDIIVLHHLTTFINLGKLISNYNS